GVGAPFDGSYTVATVPANNKFTYTVPSYSVNGTSGSVASKVATLTTSAAHGLAVGETVNVSTGDLRFDGSVTVTAVPSNNQFSYTPKTVPTTSWTWSSATRTVTQTVTTPPHGLLAGDVITMTGF